MIQLYYSNGTCSLAPRIVLEEIGLPFKAIRVSFERPLEELSQLNPMEAVPILRLEDGQILTEGAVIMQYLADLRPESGILPARSTFERYRAQEWLNFIATEIHKGFGPLFALKELSGDPLVQARINDYYWSDLGRKFDVILGKMGSQPYLMPQGFTAADAYLFTTLSWTRYIKKDLSEWPVLIDYMERVKNRPAVQQALQAEHLTLEFIRK